VGKSSLVGRYVDDDFQQRFIATIGVDFRIKTFDRHGKVVKLQIWDSKFILVIALY
jgi:GTPase SAR1 family protein